MRLDFSSADKDIDAALAINPRLLTAYIMRMSMAMPDGNAAKYAEAFSRGRELFPTSYLLYRQALGGAFPRWGGSYPKMEKIASDAYQHIDQNPQLYMLFGLIYSAQAQDFRDAKDYDKAIALCAKALAYGDNPDVFYERIRAEYAKKDYAGARKDAEYSSSLWPIRSEPYLYRAAVAFQTGDYESAKKDILFVRQQLPLENESWSGLSWASTEFMYGGHKVFEADPASALARYDLALEANPRNADAYYWRGRVYLKLKQPERARADFENAIKCDPHMFVAYHDLDNYVLMPQRKWDEILPLWNQFLLLEPRNADAHLERAGTYHYKGDSRSANEDLHQACVLGSRRACDIERRHPL